MILLAQFAVERVLNSLPEGLLIAIGAWLLLRCMGRQNSGTRFAVWFVALAGVVVLPFLSGLESAQQSVQPGLSALVPHAHTEITIPAFWASAFFALWIVVAAAALARIVAGVVQVRRIRSRCAEVPVASLDPALQALLAAAQRPVRLLTSPSVHVPAALGFRNPAIVLPAWTLRDLDAAALRPILIHELAHLDRRDDWTNLLQKTIRALLFFHPAVWWIDARLSIEREMACDDAVLAATGNPRAYAGCLIDLLEKGCARRGWTMAQAAIARAHDASLRIARILRVGPTVSTRIGRAALGVAASLALLSGAIALCTPQFIGFAPIASLSAAQLARPSVDNDLAPSPAAMIPASFHPAAATAIHPATAKRTPASRPALRQAALRQAASHSPALRQTALLKKRTPWQPALMARFTATDATDFAAPVTVFFESSDLKMPGFAQLRTTGAERQTNSARAPQPAGNPALRIQVLQIVDPETGTPMQIFRIVFVVPQQDGTSQSI